MNKEVRVGFLPLFLEIAVAVDLLESGFSQQPAGIVLAQRKHIEIVPGAVRKDVFEACETVIDIDRLGHDLVAAIVVLVFAGKAAVEDAVVIALVEDQDAVMLECGVELGQRAAPIVLVEQMGKAVAEANNGVELAVDPSIEPPPIGMDGLKNEAAKDQQRLGALGAPLRREISVSDDRLANPLELLRDHAALTVVLLVIAAGNRHRLDQHQIAKGVPLATEKLPLRWKRRGHNNPVSAARRCQACASM